MKNDMESSMGSNGMKHRSEVGGCGGSENVSGSIFGTFWSLDRRY